jgi:hypothetical protein
MQKVRSRCLEKTYRNFPKLAVAAQKFPAFLRIFRFSAEINKVKNNSLFYSLLAGNAPAFPGVSPAKV